MPWPRTLMTMLGLMLALGAVASATAQTMPTIKPGLWNVQMDRVVDGQKAPDPTDRMKSLSPEMRARMEAMMKEKGVSMGGGGINKLCLSRDTIERGNWKEEQQGCKTDFSERSAKRWKWHSVCTEMNVVSDGEASFPDSENYTVVTSSTIKANGQDRVTKMTMNARWAGDNCGDLKPMQPRK
jgi:hypothetical protein